MGCYFVLKLLKDKATILIAFLFIPHSGIAGSLCEYYEKTDPEMAKMFCGSGSNKAKPAGAQSTLSESFNMNAASLATEPSSYGVEAIYTAIKTNTSLRSSNFALVKGFKKLGSGISTSESNTFFNNDILRRQYSTPELKNFEPYETAQRKFGNINIGSAVELFEPSPFLNIKLGVSIRYNKYSDTWGSGPALLISTPWLSIGGGLVREKIASTLPRINFISTSVSLRLLFLELEYDQLLSNDPFNLAPVHIGSGNLKIQNWILTVAAKRSLFHNYGMVTQWHYALQYLFGKSLSLGYLDNYIPGTRSIGLQLYL